MKKNNSGIGLILTIILLSFLCIGIGIRFYNSTRDKLYNERIFQVEELTSQISATLNVIVDMQWYKIDIAERMLKEKKLADTDQLFSYIDEVQEVFSFDEKNSRIALVDSTGKYYSTESEIGNWPDCGSLGSDKEQQQILLFDTYAGQGNKLIYMKRMDEPVLVGDKEITHIFISVDMNLISGRFRSKVYDGNNMTCIVDKNGTRLYYDTTGEDIFSSYNIISSLQQAKYMYNSSYDQLMEEFDEGGHGSAFVQIGEEKYYLALHRMSMQDWTVIFMVPDEDVIARTAWMAQEVIKEVVLSVCFFVSVVFIIIISFLIMKKNHQVENARRQAVLANHAKSDFLSHISHDIRTPINGIMGMLKIADDNIDNPDIVKDCHKKIKTASHHLFMLINDVLDVSKLESGKMQLKYEPFDMQEMVECCAAMVESQVKDKHMEFVKDFRGFEHRYVVGSELRIRQIIINILSNSLKYTPEKGKIIFSTYEENKRYCFVVKDNGIGMSEEYQKHIFESFSQENAEARTTYVGTGLGMTIVKSLVDSMKGTISVQSEKNIGSIFTVKIPLETADDAAQEKLRANDGTDTSGEHNKKDETDNLQDVFCGSHILMAEDNDLNREVATYILQEKKIEVTAVANGKQALETFETSKQGEYDMILMDVMMPVMNGIDATKAIRNCNHPDAKNIPVIAMTANAFDEDVKTAKEAGMTDHVAKPLDIYKLYETIEKYLKKTGIAMILLIFMLSMTAGCAKSQNDLAAELNKDSMLHDSVRIMSLGADYSRFAKLLKETYPEVNLEVLPYDGYNPEIYCRNMVKAGVDADIFVTDSRISKEVQKEKLMDLSGYGFTSRYNVAFLKKNDVDGQIYQLPGCYTFVGIIYNKKLFAEHGWEMPESFEELEELAPKIKEAGVNLAITNFDFMGYCFQYFTNVGLAVDLGTVQGEQWQQDFLAGKAKAEGNLDDVMEYLQKWIDVGMFSADSIVYDGAECDRFFSEGNTAFLIYGDSFEYNNFEMKLDENYGMMPWLSEDGTNNYYITRVISYYSLNKKLLEAGNEQKLEDCVKVMELLSTKEGQEALMQVDKQYRALPLNGSRITEDNYYYDLIDEIDKGHTYGRIFDGWEDIYVPIGHKMYDMICGNITGQEFERSIDKTQQANLERGCANNYMYLNQELDTPSCARLIGNMFMEGTQADGALISYNKFIGYDCSNSEGVNGKLFSGPFDKKMLGIILPTGWHGNIKTITITGKELKKLAETGYKKYEEHEAYPYELILKEKPIDDNKIYTIAVCGITDELAQKYDIADSGIMGLTAADDYLRRNRLKNTTDILEDYVE